MSLNRRTAPPEADERIGVKLDRFIRAVERGNTECFVISHSLYRFIRHQLIYAAALPVPGEDAKALGKKRYEAFLDDVAKMMAQSRAKGADNDNDTPSAARNGIAVSKEGSDA